MKIKRILIFLLFVSLGSIIFNKSVDSGIASTTPAANPEDWPQLGHDPQRTNYSPVQVEPPYCYTWKWYEVPIASRIQPVVANGRLFIGSLNGAMYARDASTGANLWVFDANSPIRSTAGVSGNTVIFSTHHGWTYALSTSDGSLRWKTFTGSSQTAPLIDDANGRAYIASTNSNLTALSIASGAQLWSKDTGAPILTSPTLSANRYTIYVGNEDIYAIALRASDGGELWRTRLQGQSLADRYPVVAGQSVLYRSQPLYFFHVLLKEGDEVMDQAGSLNPDWEADWSNVRPRIESFLSSNPSKQTFFALNASSGNQLGTVPVLYTYGNNDPPNVPVVGADDVFVTYRARHGIQTDGGHIHVTTKYDAEIGRMDLSTLDIEGLRATEAFNTQFSMTSDEPSMLSMGGDILYSDNWERLGGINVETGDLIHVGAVSNDWPECYAQCGPGTQNPYFPLSGNSSDPAYPFPNPRVKEGHQRGGLVIANDMLYWRVIEGGLAGISHVSGSCPNPIVHTSTPGTPPTGSFVTPPDVENRPIEDYINLDLTQPVSNPPSDLVQRLRNEVKAITSAGGHLVPYYLERGFSAQDIWPYNTIYPPGPSEAGYGSHGNIFWHDPGELLLTLAQAYPYLDSNLQSDVESYVQVALTRYPIYENLPYDGIPWLREGIARERFEVPFRSEINNWPPVAANMSAVYSLWLWSKNSGDWSYAQDHWSDIKSFYDSRRGSMLYYADMAGAIGYARLALHFNDTSAYQDAVSDVVNALQDGRDFDEFKDRAANDYLDPRSNTSGWSAPVFYGLTPEIGLYLREKTSEEAVEHLASLEDGNGLQWWYFTRAGVHAELGESSYLTPFTAWSHFLAHAYIVGDSPSKLRPWLDRPWGIGDLYSIQKIVATIQSYDSSIPPVPTFIDVPFDHWAYDYIMALYNAGYVVGCSSDPPMYCPELVLDRVEGAVFTLRGQHGSLPNPPYPTPETPTFEDVDISHWGFGWVESLWTDGFTSGCGVDPLIYCPDLHITRAEASVFFLRIKLGADYTPPEATGLFDDVQLDSWYANWVESAFNEGLLPACSEDPLRFCPNEPIDRAWTAYMMVQAKGGLPLSDEPSEADTPTATTTATQTITTTPTATISGTPLSSSTLTPTPTLHSSESSTPDWTNTPTLDMSTPTVPIEPSSTPSAEPTEQPTDSPTATTEPSASTLDQEYLGLSAGSSALFSIHQLIVNKIISWLQST